MSENKPRILYAHKKASFCSLKVHTFEKFYVRQIHLLLCFMQYTSDLLPVPDSALKLES